MNNLSNSSDLWAQTLNKMVSEKLENGSERKDALISACERKYGNTRYFAIHRHEREISGWQNVFSEVCETIGLGSLSQRILAVGVNDGMDIETLVGCEIVGIDLCLPALLRARATYPEHLFLHRDAEATFLDESSFDGYLALRLVNSSTINVTALLDEMIRVLKPGSPFVFSVANGHFEDGVFTEGMYKDGKLNPTAHKDVQAILEKHLSQLGCSVFHRYHVGEAFVFGKLKSDE